MFPAEAAAYYGPNDPFRKALEADGDSWRLVKREAVGNNLSVRMTLGKLERVYPLRVRVDRKGNAACAMTGGVGYVPVTFAGLKQNRGFELLVDGEPLKQGIHQNDFWQTDFDELRKEWQVTFNIPRDDQRTSRLQLHKIGSAAPSD
jgi:hypothetical protein